MKGTTLKRVRSILSVSAALSVLAGLYSFVRCGSHFCMAGHFKHPPYPTIEIASDVLWVTLLAYAFLAGILSNMKLRLLFCIPLGILLAQRYMAVAGISFSIQRLLPELIVLIALGLLPLSAVFELLYPVIRKKRDKQKA
jgi:hypothetical protein